MVKLYRRFILLFPLLFYLTHGVQGQVIGFTLNEGLNKVSIPFELHNNLIVVPVVLNNAIPLKFILDTGVRTAILTEKAISDLMQINYDRKISLIGGGGGDTIDAYIAHNVTLTLPGVSGHGHALLILQEDYLQLKNTLGINVHGILGYEIFGRFIVKIDYINEVLTLIEPAAYRPKRSNTMLPLTVEDTKPYVNVHVTVNDTTRMMAKLMIDTGASHSLLLDPASNENIVLPEKVIDGKLGRGLSGDIIGHLGRIEDLKLENFEFREIIASFPEVESYRSIRENTDRNGTIGAGLLSRFTVTIDYFNERLYLKKNRHYSKPFEYNMSGMDIQSKGEGFIDFEVNYVREGSPADEAGVKRGDEILSINGTPVRYLELGDIFNYLSSKDGRTIKLKLKRGDEVISASFRLHRLI